MTLAYRLDLNILKVYAHTKNEFLDQGFRKLEHELTGQTDTDRRDRTHYQPHLDHVTIDSKWICDAQMTGHHW